MSNIITVNIEDVQEYKVASGIRVKPLHYTKEYMAMIFIVDDHVPRHKHGNTQFGFVINGKGVFSIGDEEFILSSGNFYHIPPNVEHGVKVLEGPLHLLDIFIPPRRDYLKFFNR